MKNLNQLIKEELFKNGASIVGFADLNEIPESIRNNMKYGISIGVALNPEVVRNIEFGPTKEYYSEYKRINGLLDELDELTSRILISNGFNAIAKTTGNVNQDEETLSTILPHKTVATRAGLGWIGKCALLVTKQFGPALRLSTVLTDAELNVAEPINSSNCGTCNECKNHCPGNAIIGANWSLGAERNTYYNAYECAKTARKLSNEVGINSRICGKCIFVCPWTKKYLQDNSGAVLIDNI